MSFFQNSTGSVDPNIARFAIYSYYNLEAYFKNLFSLNVPTMTSKQKWKLSSKIPQLNWNNHSGCLPLSDSHLLMAMRTPKAASTTLEELIDKLSITNHFIVNKVALLSLTRPEPDNEAQFERISSYCKYFSSLSKRTVSVAHIRYLDFIANSSPQPIYIGTIRNPVTRMQSHYNYDHFADRPWHISHQERGTDIANKPPTFIECIRSYMNETIRSTLNPSLFTCMNPVYLNVQLRYFCGMDPVCKRGSLDTILSKALINLNQRFRVVVIVEEMDRSISLLDKLIPTFFAGAKEVYASSSEGGLHSNTNTKVTTTKKSSSTSSSKTSSSSSSTTNNNNSSSSSSSSTKLIHGIPSDVYNYLAQVLSHEMILYEAALQHSQHNAQQCNIP